VLGEAFEESGRGFDQRGQIRGHRVRHDRMGGIEVAVREVVAHPLDVDPGDLGFVGDQVRVEDCDCFADLGQPDADGVEDQAVGDLAPS
jgi:hypothetical protein